MLELRLDGARSAEGSDSVTARSDLNMTAAWSVGDNIGGWSAERQGQKGSERRALFTPGPLPCMALVTIVFATIT